MKQQTKLNLRLSLQSLGIIFVIFFAMAFACKDETDTNPSPNPDPNPPRNAGNFCTTEREFKAFINFDKTYLAKDYEQIEVIFNNFNVGAPRRFENMRGDRFDTVTDNAYPVTTSFDVITRGDSMKTNKIYRDRYVNASYMCYPVMWSDGKNCVCFGIKNNFAVTSREEISEGDY